VIKTILFGKTRFLLKAPNSAQFNLFFASVLKICEFLPHPPSPSPLYEEGVHPEGNKEGEGRKKSFSERASLKFLDTRVEF